MESSTYQALGFPEVGILSFGRTLSKQRNTPSRHRDAGEVLGDYPIPTGASQERVPLCAPFPGYFPTVFKMRFQPPPKVASFSFLFFFFWLRANLEARTEKKYQPPLLNILLDHLGPKGLRQNRDPCPKISSV